MLENCTPAGSRPIGALLLGCRSIDEEEIVVGPHNPRPTCVLMDLLRRLEIQTETQSGRVCDTDLSEITAQTTGLEQAPLNMSDGLFEQIHDAELRANAT